jgi:hypothetical protein
VIERYMTSTDPWIRAAAPLLRGSFGRMLGHINWAESGCRESLAAGPAGTDAPDQERTS